MVQLQLEGTKEHPTPLLQLGPEQLKHAGKEEHRPTKLRFGRIRGLDPTAPLARLSNHPRCHPKHWMLV